MIIYADRDVTITFNELRESAESGFIEPYKMSDFRIAEATL